MALISCQNVSLSYEGVTVLSGLSFDVNAGDYLCVVGENGSGKSTLVRALLSLKCVDSGKLELGDGLLRRDIGYLPQQAGLMKDFPASVGEVVLSGCLNSMGCRPFFSKADRARALSSMERMGIAELSKRSFGELSGGQRQRALLARALCAASRLLLLDEPTAGLDPLVTEELYRIIDGLNDEGVTIIMVSHDIHSAVEHASHILHLHNLPLYFGVASEYAKSTVGSRFLGGVHDV